MIIFLFLFNSQASLRSDFQAIGKYQKMKVKPAFIFCAVMMVIFGLLFVIIPAIALSLFDISLSAEGIAMVRLFGASLVGYAVMLWLSKGDMPSEARRHMILGETTHSAIATVILFISMIWRLWD